jgi:hypothetical protein
MKVDSAELINKNMEMSCRPAINICVQLVQIMKHSHQYNNVDNILQRI